MITHLRSDLAESYHSAAQKARVITETWVAENIYCPFCGCAYINHHDNNKPVADFYCPNCSEDYELKSKSGTIENKIVDGAYKTMIERITSTKNPNFFFMRYDKQNFDVKDFIVVPKYFFSTEIIERRKPLASTARRAGWTGCNILIKKIPPEGQIFIIKNGVQTPEKDVLSKVARTGFIKEYRLEARGWILDILNCVNSIPDNMFTLETIYRFEDELSAKHPENHHVKDKIRQQLQVLRDKGIIEFNGRGSYSKKL